MIEKSYIERLRLKILFTFSRIYEFFVYKMYIRYFSSGKFLICLNSVFL